MQAQTPRSVSPGVEPGEGAAAAAAAAGGGFSRSPSGRKHVQFNQEQLQHQLAPEGCGQGCGPACMQREGSVKGLAAAGRRRSAIQRAPLPEESSLELQEGEWE